MNRLNPRHIGWFALGGFSLLVIGLVTFGSFNWFKERYTVEMVFQGSVKGLGIGSSITFRGVRVGEVVSIELDLPERAESAVLIRVRGALVARQDSSFLSPFRVREFFDEQVQRGLRAQLVPESLVTGRLQIQLELFDREGGYAVPSPDGTFVIPTVPSDIEVISETLQHMITQFDRIPVAELAAELHLLLNSANRTLNSPEFAATLKNTAIASENLNLLLTDLRADRALLVPSFYQTSESLRDMSAKVKDTSLRAKDLVFRTHSSLEKLDVALVQARSTLKQMEEVAAPGDEINRRLLRTLDSISLAANEFRQLAETLKRNPEAVVRGKQR